MATERTAPPLASFFKFTTLGQKVIGPIKSYRTNEQGGLITLGPAGIVNERGGKVSLYAAVTVGLSTDLNLKITVRDVGKYVSIEYANAEPTKKGSKKKIFRVLELDRAELIAAMDGADRTHREEVYTIASAIDEGEGVTQATADDDDELPF